jgi:hypothetical protein
VNIKKGEQHRQQQKKKEPITIEEKYQKLKVLFKNTMRQKEMLEQNLQSRNNEFGSPSVSKQNKFESPQEVLCKISGVKVLDPERETAGFRGESEQEAGFLQGEGLSVKGDNLRAAALDLQAREGERGEQDADRGPVLPDQGPHRAVEVLQD